MSPRPTSLSASFSQMIGLMSSRASSPLVIPVLRRMSVRICCSVWPWLTREREYSTPLSICSLPGGTVMVLLERLGRSVGIRSSSSAATTAGPSVSIAPSTIKPRPCGLIGSIAGVAPSELLPERRLLPARLRQTLPALVEVRVRKQDRDHLLAAPVPEPEPPGRRRTRVAIGPEEGGAGYATDTRQLRAGRAAVIVDAQVEMPDPGVDRQVSVERRHRWACGESDLVGGALDQRSDGEFVPVLREELGQQALDPVARDGHLAVLGGDAVQPALARRHTPSEGMLLQIEDDRQLHPQRPRLQAGRERLGRQAPHCLDGGLVELRVRRRAGDRDRADRAVGSDQNFQVHRALDSAPTRRRRILDRLLDAPPDAGEVAAVFRSGLAARSAWG